MKIRGCSEEVAMKNHEENEDDLLTQKLTGVDIIYKEIPPTTRKVVNFTPE